MIYSNQKIVTIHKALTDKNNPYTILNNKSMYKAMQNLKYNEFKIYMYLSANQDGYKFALSTKDISEKTGANKRKIQESINSLIEKKYLIPTDDNNYIFVEDVDLCLDNVIAPMSKKDIDLCPKSTHPMSKKDTQILQYNINNTLDNYADADHAADAANEQMSVQQIIDNDKHYNNINTIPDDLIRKVIELYQDGKKYNNGNPQIQNETGLNGKIIYQIIDKYKNGDLKVSSCINVEEILSFGKDNGYISVEIIKNTIKERSVPEFDEQAILNIYKEYYEVSMDYVYKGCIEKKNVIDWFKRHFKYEFES